MNSIEVVNLSTGYVNTKVIDELSLSIKPREFIGIIGPNGCGKSTLLKSMTRILKPESGTVYIDGRELTAYRDIEFARKVGCVSQMTETEFRFSVRDIVLMGRYPYIGKFKPLNEKDIQIADEAMKFTHIYDLKDRLITELSGGERQRVLIAKTLAQQPQILLLDEPTNHLDISHQIEILQMIRTLTPNITIVCVLHDLNLASCFCDRLIMMNQGKIVTMGTPQEVLTHERIYETFAVRMIVSTHPVTGKPCLIPEYHPISSTKNTRVHVISGGGTGTELMYSLILHGYTVTAGILSRDDSDAISAEKLGIKTIWEPPFSTISKTSIDTLKTTVETADYIVLTGMPVGNGNLVNLALLQSVRKPIFILGTFTDFTGGKLNSILESLKQNGAREVKDINTLIPLLSYTTTP